MYVPPKREKIHKDGKTQGNNLHNSYSSPYIIRDSNKGGTDERGM
jgi:hypothetical protein